MRKKFLSKRSNAKRKGIEFTIEMDDVEYPTHCPVLGIELVYHQLGLPRTDGRRATYDRIDSSKGYIPGNVVVMSYRANTLKGDGTLREHQLLTEWMTSYDS